MPYAFTFDRNVIWTRLRGEGEGAGVREIPKEDTDTRQALEILTVENRWTWIN